jgi:methylenetetrahydrofolate dehydrogenase (NADP+) / methenyltetrahydrofolate cyclohydrolase
METLLEGKKVAESIYTKILLEASLLASVPKIVFILVGEDAASQTYVKSKGKKCLDLGFSGETLQLSGDTSEETLISKIRTLNKDRDVHGILLQLPLPKHINKHQVLHEIDPLKDVDGLHPDNSGRLFQGDPRFIPCTPAGIIEMLKFYNIPIEGKRAVVVGRSEIVGKPMAQLLLMNNATVTVCHSRTIDLVSETSRADILIAALGKPKSIGEQHVKAGAVVVDVGIHRVDGKLVGDVDFDKVQAKCSAISPVPGGVGPLTIALLMRNVLLATKLQSKR